MGNKWDFLIETIEQCIAKDSDITPTQIAELVITQFNLGLTREQARKIISRIMNEKLNKKIEENKKQDIEVGGEKYSFITLGDLEEIPAKVTYTPVDEQAPSIKYNRPGQYLILGCWHVPFHNKKMTEGVLKLMDNIDLQGVIFNGDFLDCNSLSNHDKGKFTAIPNLTLKQEYQEGLKVLREFDAKIPKGALKVYMYGNHEDRYWRFINEMQNAKTPPQSPSEGLRLAELGYITLEQYGDNFLTLGAHLDVIHGIFYNDHCAKKHIDRFRGSCLFAHTHRIQSYIEGHVGGFNIGWGGDKNSPAFRYADRATKASWQNGFAIVNIDENGDYYVNQVICNNGNFYYDGKKY